jgi:hypothetical protein
MRFLAILALVTAFIPPTIADDGDPAINPADIPTPCTVLCTPIVQLANGCQAISAAPGPADDDKRRWLNSVFLHRRDDDDGPPATTADPCICNNATVAFNTVAPPCDTCIQANGATTAGLSLPSFQLQSNSNVGE